MIGNVNTQGIEIVIIRVDYLINPTLSVFLYTCSVMALKNNNKYRRTKLEYRLLVRITDTNCILARNQKHCID